MAALDSESRPTPNPQQRAWQCLELIAFAHFGVNTFTERESGVGKEDPKLLNPNLRQALKAVFAMANHP